MPRAGVTVWDQKLGRTLYDQGASYVAIGAAVGVSSTMVASFASRYWPKRDEAALRKLNRKPRRDSKPKPARALRPGATTLAPLASLRDDPA